MRPFYQFNIILKVSSGSWFWWLIFYIVSDDPKMWLIKRCHGARECCIVPNLWRKYILKHVSSSEIEGEMSSEKWIMLRHWCQQLLYEVSVWSQYRPCRLTADECEWLTLNDDDEMIDHWLDDWYDEEYGPSSETGEETVSWNTFPAEPLMPIDRLEWEPQRPITKSL